MPEGSWVDAPLDHIILGLKELDETKDFPLRHAHVTFAHCYKGQGGWEKALGRWSRGNGVLYDLEFLQVRKIVIHIAGNLLESEVGAHQGLFNKAGL